MAGGLNDYVQFTFSNNFIEKKLFYSGINGSDLYVLYREYKQGKNEPSINETKYVDFQNNPYISINGFFLEVISANTSQAEFLFLDEKTWISLRDKHIQEQQKKQKEEKLSKIIESIGRAHNEALLAKNFVMEFVNIVPILHSFKKASYDFDLLSAELFEANENKSNNTDDLIEINQIMKERIYQYTQFFQLVKSTLEAWGLMKHDLKNAIESGMPKEYLSIPLHLKDIGEQELQGENYSAASQKFLQSRQEISRIVTLSLEN